MKTLVLSILGIFLLTAYNAPTLSKKSDKLVVQQKTTFDFENYQVGKAPAGWSNFLTGKGDLGKWEILDHKGNKILAQTSEKNFGYHFDVIVNDELSYKDVEISVKFKGIAGQEDQGGGPVWRYQDADNYYIARANPLENNYRVYKVIDGNRKQLKSFDLPIKTGRWYILRITMKGDEINCYFDGERKLEVNDDSFPNAGKIGLWTKADAVTYFDNLRVKAIK
jgi:hypothetical protein